LKRVIVSNDVDLLPAWKRLFGRAFDKVPTGTVSRDRNVYSFKKLIHRYTRDLPSVRTKGDEIAEILYTAGTIKSPKGVPFSHRLFLESSEEQLSISDPLFPKEENMILAGAPTFHILGQSQGLASICVAGGTLILQPKMNLDGMLKTIERFWAKTLIGVPTLYRRILQHARTDLYETSVLCRYCFCGGDVLTPEVSDQWLERFNIPIYHL
jgi:long-chain acyl-CoA synthetase